MGMKRCPICGEKYSDTYRNCPFCEEEELEQKRHPGSRKVGGRRAGHSREPNFLSPILVIIIMVLALLLGYLFFGDAIGEKLFGSAASSAESSQTSSDIGAEEPDVSAPDGSGSTDQNSTGNDTVDLSALPETLTLSSSDFTMTVGDAPVKLKVSGGAGSYTWISEDESIATVDQDGNVTAVSKGTVNVIAADGSGKGTCIVRVKGGSGTVNTGSGTSAISLSNTDVTLKVGDTLVLSTDGVPSISATWASSDPQVATVDSTGGVTALAAGQANVTATVNGQTYTCIVRVKG